MKKFTIASLLAAGLILSGCVPSLNPLYTEKDLVFDPALVGVWGDDDQDDNTWAFEKAGEHRYKLVIADGDKSSPFVAHLVQLGEHRFLDLCPDKAGLEELKRDDIYKVALIRGHLFLKVVQIKPTLQVTMLDANWLSKLLEKEPKALAHQEMEGDSGLLTASTKELQAFVVKHWHTEGAWGDKPSDMKRKHQKVSAQTPKADAK